MLDAAGVQKILDEFAALKALKGGGGGADAKKAANADKAGKIEARVSIVFVTRCDVCRKERWRRRTQGIRSSFQMRVATSIITRTTTQSPTMW